MGGHWKGWALKIETFLGPEMARASVIWAQKSRDFRGTPSSAPRNDVASRTAP
jgi:hypothetical protein